MTDESDLSVLSNMVAPALSLDQLPKRRRVGIQAVHKRSNLRSAESNYERWFFDQRDRPTPSLPKLKFLEGKD